MINGKDYIFSALDEFVEVSGATVPFELERGSEAVYAGVARQFPDGSPIRFYLNRMAEPYLDTSGWNGILFSSTGMTSNPEAGASFSIVEQDSGTTVCSAYVIKGEGTVTGLTSNPINGLADPRQRLFISHAGGSKSYNFKNV